ncbi:MAG: hypothetical protein MUO34_03440 [Ignavibacteriaceae bacterium]|nr:hypothetical protein [Ignavibacteriaceae bacterium]
MLKHFIKILLLFIVIINNTETKAQSFGFGCFGFVSGYAGYSYQSFEPGYLKFYGNELRTPIGLITDPYFDQFGEAKGFRVGLNFYRAKFSGIFLTAKGHFQFLSERKNIIVSDSYPDVEYDLSLKSWGLGIDVGIPISKLFDWKIFDGELLFNSVRFKRTINNVGITSVKTYNNDSPEIGFSIGTGFIVYLIEGYISLEGTAGYTIMKIEKMLDDEGNNFLGEADLSDESNFIKAGGFKAVLQLNVGFPL